MLGLVCMLDGKGMKKGVNALKNFNLEKVKEAALFNLDYTLECIKFCLKNNYIYRVSSSVIPYPDLWNWREDRDILEKLKLIKEYSSKIRLIIHPDQFVVLNSDSEKVIENSLKILESQVQFAKLAGISELVLHIGKKDGIEKFIETYKKLDSYFYLELTPVDPRSLLQGDYLTLNYDITDKASDFIYNNRTYIYDGENENEVDEIRELRKLADAKRAYIAVRLDENKVAKFVKITAASLKESHPHDIHITKEAPNYSIDE